MGVIFSFDFHALIFEIIFSTKRKSTKAAQGPVYPLVSSRLPRYLCIGWQTGFPMKPAMVLSEEDVQRVRESLMKTLTPRHKVVIAPCLAEVFVLNKSKSILRRSIKEKWNLIGKGVIALVYNTDSLGQRIEICLTSLKTRAITWRETVLAHLTRIESPQLNYHTFNSTKNFCEKTAIRYDNDTVAGLVLRALSVFSSQSKSLRVTNGGHKPALRSHSFNVAPRPKHPRAQENAIERCTVALSNMQVQQVLSSEGRSVNDSQSSALYTREVEIIRSESKQSDGFVSSPEMREKSSTHSATTYHPNNRLLSCKQPARSKSFNLVRRRTEPVIERREPMVTDLCTTEL